jgi:putative toxin-antitoxin system antitoxin component (TIGR02293 family)
MAKAKRVSPGFKHYRRKEGDQKTSKSQRSMTIESVREGLSIKWLVKVASELRVPQRTLAEVLNISSRTFDRRLKGGVLSPTESDSLARVARLLERATEIFGSVEKARGWMSTPLAALGGETPLQRADTSVGAMQVDDLLGRIDYGVYS